MGQYYYIANMDKKEYLLVNRRAPGRKLLEIAMDRNAAQAILNRIAEEWKGDHVFLVGDYADLDDKKVIYFDTLREWCDRLHTPYTLYDYIDENFTGVEGEITDKGYRFIYNHEKKEYIDILHCPTYHTDDSGWMQNHISPLALLIAMGNGRGGGDYYNRENDKLVGSWCSSIASVEITREPIDDLGYTEIHPDFFLRE
ncbi:MAG: hypothetical protein WBK46_03220 [Ruminococcus flavefaciens]